MTDEQKIRISVEIYGQTYHMVGSETSSKMRQVASIVDDRMREISDRNPSLDTAKIAVLTAVNAIHHNLKLKEQIEQLQNELKNLKG